MYATIIDGPWAFPVIEGQFKDFEMQTAPIPQATARAPAWSAVRTS